MAFLAPLVGGIGGLLVKKLIDGPGRPPSPLRPVTRDDAAQAIIADDEARKRRGGAADILTGATGAEPVLTGGKLVLGS